MCLAVCPSREQSSGNKNRVRSVHDKNCDLVQKRGTYSKRAAKRFSTYWSPTHDRVRWHLITAELGGTLLLAREMILFDMLRPSTCGNERFTRHRGTLLLEKGPGRSFGRDQH